MLADGGGVTVGLRPGAVVIVNASRPAAPGAGEAATAEHT